MKEQNIHQNHLIKLRQSKSQKRLQGYKRLLKFPDEEIQPQIRIPKSPRATNPIGIGKSNAMRKMKEMKDIEMQIVMCQIQSVRAIFSKDFSKDAKLHILEKAISIVDKNKANFGKMKNMSSLEKNRIALNLLSTLKFKDATYLSNQNQAVQKNLHFQEVLTQRKQISQTYQHDRYSDLLKQECANTVVVTPLDPLSNNQKTQEINAPKNIPTTSVARKRLQASNEIIIYDKSALEKFNPDLQKNLEEERRIQKNLRLNFLIKNKKTKGDPLKMFGIKTLYSNIPYKKPVLKQ